MSRNSIEIGKLAGALAKAQGMFGTVSKTKSVQVRMKSGGTYSYKYADLGDIIAATRKPLAENGLAVTQHVMFEGRTARITTMLFHSSGECMSFVLDMDVNEKGPQALGSAITYGRRYTLSSLLNIASEDDEDGNLANANETVNNDKEISELKGRINKATAAYTDIKNRYNELLKKHNELLKTTKPKAPFDYESTKHQTMLVELLEKRDDVQPYLYDRIGKALNGKMSSELGAVIKQVIDEYEKERPKEETNEGPENNATEQHTGEQQ